jgi:hypothetical protein
VSRREYVPPFNPLPPAAVEALTRFLDGQSAISAAYEVGAEYRALPDSEPSTEDSLWFELAGRRSHLSRHALSAGLREELMPSLRGGLRPSVPQARVAWNYASRRKLAKAGPAANLLWRMPEPAQEGLDPLDYELRWRALEPPPEFVAAAAAVLAECRRVRRAYLIEEVLLKNGVRVTWWPRIYLHTSKCGWPGATVNELMALGHREWRRMAVGRERVFPPTAEHATEIFRGGEMG